MQTWITSDSHLGHVNIIKYESRPFHDVREMDDYIIHHWNKMVGKDDRVYFLGDFTLGPPDLIRRYLHRLNYGSMIWIKGNHDRGLPFINSLPRVFGLKRIVIRVPNLGDLLMTHEPKDYIPSEALANLHGHIHGMCRSDVLRQEKDTGRIWVYVGMDTNNLKPWNMGEVVARIKRHRRNQ